ncbi:MAG: hypothetical protein PWP23_2309 [Candidatus Sumerlaeota bacterium]|nr:hypothetical protein [Candidatus Sumerlaeota bacterium]
MASSDEGYRWQFEKLVRLYEEGPREALEDLCHKVLVHGQDMLEPLAGFIVEQPDSPRLAILLELIGKIGDPRAATILVQYLESDCADLRVQAAIGLGWLRSRLGIMKLDELEGRDPDNQVRMEARVAIEEILREYPAIRQALRHHQPLPIDEQRFEADSEDDFAKLNPLTPERQKRLAALLPRVLALRYKAVPLATGASGVVSFAILGGRSPESIGADLKRLTGREVELHAWPEQRLYDHLLTFYKWGDDDWVKFRGELTDEARREVAEILLSKVDPELPNAALPDCIDSLEAVQSFLSLCLREQTTSALVEYDRAAGECRLLLHVRDGSSFSLDPPPTAMRGRFMRVLQTLAGCGPARSATREVREGSIRFAPEADKRPVLVSVTCETIGTREAMALDFLDPHAN